MSKSGAARSLSICTRAQHRIRRIRRSRGRLTPRHSPAPAIPRARITDFLVASVRATVR